MRAIVRATVAISALFVGALFVAVSVRAFRSGAWLDRAENHRAWGRLEAARDASQKAVDITPGNADVHAALGSAHVAIASFRNSDEAANQAILAFRRAVDLDPLDPTLHASLAEAHARFDELEAAASAYRNALEFDPHNALFLGALATVLERQGHVEQAIELYRRALSIAPDQALRARLERLESNVEPPMPRH